MDSISTVRMLGDAIDLALPGVVGNTRRLRGARLAGALASVAGVTALDVIAALRKRRSRATAPVAASIAIARSPDEVYASFRALSQLPLVMDALALVREADATYSHWVARLPAGGTIAWDVKIVEDRPGEALAWRSVEGSLISMRGRMALTRAGRRATEVRLEIELDDLGTRSSRAVAALFTAAHLESDLYRLKRRLETEVAGQGDVRDATVTVRALGMELPELARPSQSA